MSEQLTPLHKHAMFEFVWQCMRELNVGMIVVSFDGSGDSGDITDISPVAEGTDPNSPMDADMQAANVALFARWDAYALPPGIIPERENSMWISPAPTTLRELVHELSNEILSYGSAPDWVNNDGGYGELKWIAEDDETPASIEVEYNIRIVSSELEMRGYNKFGEEDYE